MARLNANLSFFMLTSDYDPAHYNWTEKELSTLGDCKATAEVIKKRLEDNDIKVKEMYVIEHKSEKTAGSKSRKFHVAIDETKLHYQILVRFEPSHGATLKEIAEYIGVPFPIVIKPDPGRYSYPNSLAYLIHIKDIDKIPYPPQNVVTLAGSDYMDYFNKYQKMWERGREKKARAGGKPLDRLFREAVTKIEKGELSYEELCDIEEYNKLRLDPVYRKKLKSKNTCVLETALEDFYRLLRKISNNEITTLEEITANKRCELACMYHQKEIEDALQAQKAALIQQNCDILCNKIADKEITSPAEIRANEYWNLFSENQKEQITKELAKQAYQALLEKLGKEGISSMDEILSDEYWKLGYEFNKNAIGVWCSNHKIPYKWR